MSIQLIWEFLHWSPLGQFPDMKNLHGLASRLLAPNRSFFYSSLGNFGVSFGIYGGGIGLIGDGS